MVMIRFESNLQAINETLNLDLDFAQARMYGNTLGQLTSSIHIDRRQN